jgi:hypothetical protein
LTSAQEFPSLQSGKFGPSEQKGAYRYIDIKPLRAIWEPVHIGEEIGHSARAFGLNLSDMKHG